MPNEVRQIRGWAAALLLAVSILWSFWPVLDNGFVWDDGANLVVARAFWDRGLEGIAWAFTKPFSGHYQPLTWLSYQVDAQLSDATPRGVHATNLLLHVLATGLVAWLAWALGASSGVDRMERRLAFTWVAAALFALHPIRIESVAWATERRDLLSTVFVLGALVVHVRASPADSSPSRSRGWVALLHALAALSRAQLSLPFVLLLLDVWPLRRLGKPPGRGLALRRLVAEKGVSWAIAAASGLTAIWAQADSGALTTTAEHGGFGRLVQAGYGLSFYPAALIWRRAWLPLYERPFPFDPLEPRYLLSAGLAAGLLVGIWLLRRRALPLTTAVGAYVLLVLPVLGIAQSGIQLVADRYAYLATVPLVLWLAAACVKLWRTGGQSWARAWNGALAVALLAWLAVAGWATRQQAAVWRSDESLWRHVLAHSESSLADNNLGYLLSARGEPGQGLFHLVRSLERVPQYGRPWRGIAALLEAPWPADAPPAAEVAATLERALAHQSSSLLARYALALAWARAGETNRARGELQRVLAVDRNHTGARLALSRIEEARASAVKPAPRALP